MKTEIWDCPNCGEEYDVIALYTGNTDLRCLFQTDSRESYPRPILAVLHRDDLFCPRRDCHGTKLIRNHNDSTGQFPAGQPGGAIDFGARA